MEIEKYIGNKIKYYRTKKNITQQELGEYLGTTSQTISRYENGERDIGQTALFKLADYFNISINDFFPPINKNGKKDFDLLKDTLKQKGFLDENEELSEKSFDMLIEFAKANKQFIMKDNDKK